MKKQHSEYCRDNVDCNLQTMSNLCFSPEILYSSTNQLIVASVCSLAWLILGSLKNTQNSPLARIVNVITNTLSIISLTTCGCMIIKINAGIASDTCDDIPSWAVPYWGVCMALFLLDCLAFFAYLAVLYHQILSSSQDYFSGAYSTKDINMYDNDSYPINPPTHLQNKRMTSAVIVICLGCILLTFFLNLFFAVYVCDSGKC